MYSVSIGDTFDPPTLHAYDNHGDVDVVIYENNVDIYVEDTYTVIYIAINDMGETFYTITVNVVDSTNPDLPPDVSKYYSNAEGKTGNSLLTELRTIIYNYNDKGYDAARDILQISDRDPNNYNNIIQVYTRASVKGQWDQGVTWNREHVWPQTYLNGASKSDLHNLKPANNSVNGSRGSLKFAAGSGTYKAVSGGWYPGDEVKGDIARIIFYMITKYSQLSFNTMGNLTIFLEWHYEDPVDAFEINRNNVIYGYQDNRNPYIDNPDFAYSIWGYPNNYNNDLYDLSLNILFNYDYVDFTNKEQLFIN